MHKMPSGGGASKLTMSEVDWGGMPVPTARLLQIGLRSLGYYTGTTRGLPGPRTKAAYRRYLRDLGGGPVSFGEALAQVAESQVGTREVGRNGGAKVRAYQAATWLEAGPWPWCAAFVCWCWREAAKRYAMPAMRGPRTPGAWDLERWGRETAGALVVKPVGRRKFRRGDVVVFRFSHVGVCVADSGASVILTVEGNTNGDGAREGDGVYMKERARRQVRSIVRC